MATRHSNAEIEKNRSEKSSESVGQQSARGSARDLPLVEVGWLVAGKLDDADWRAVQQARELVIEDLEAAFPQFRWLMPVVRRDELTASPREQPVVLLQHGVRERNRKHWDFIVIITGAELVSQYQPQATAVVSRALDSLVVSTRQLDPRSSDPDAGTEPRVATMTARLRRLVIYGISRLGGLAACEDETNCLAPLPESSADDRPPTFSPAQRQQLIDELEEVADRRLEEADSYRRTNRWKFYLVGVWVNRRDIFHSVREARPWQFPFRLSRLTTAALSAMLVLMVTAEVWELALSQPPWSVAFLALAAVCLATAYVIVRQRLYVQPRQSRLTEQTVTTNATTALIVLLGMMTTYLSMFAVGLLAGVSLFHPRLVSQWSGEGTQSPVFDAYVMLSSFVAALALFIGALGATFESNHYFQHITFVDEEI